MRHFSRTHRVALDWLFDRINLDPKIQIKYIDTKNQLKEHKKDSGEERVTAKSKPMMKLVSRCSERTPVVRPSTASESPGKTRLESQIPLSPRTEQHQKTGRPVVYAHLSSYSEWNIDKTWSSQEWKSDELMEDRTVRRVVNAQHTDRFIVENDETNSYAEAESELSS